MKWAIGWTVQVHTPLYPGLKSPIAELDLAHFVRAHDWVATRCGLLSTVAITRYFFNPILTQRSAPRLLWHIDSGIFPLGSFIDDSDLWERHSSLVRHTTIWLLQFTAYYCLLKNTIFREEANLLRTRTLPKNGRLTLSLTTSTRSTSLSSFSESLRLKMLSKLPPSGR